MNKTSHSPRYRKTRLTIFVAACLAANSALAADYYNFGVNGTRLDTATNYANTDGSAVAATVNPGASDNLFFYNSTVTSPTNIWLLLGGTARTFNSMTFRSNAGTTQINRDVEGSGTGNNTVLSIGAGGITLDAGAGAVSYGKLADSGDNQRVTVGAVASFTISNNSSSNLTFNRDFDGRSTATNVITVAGAGSGNTIFAGGILANTSGRDLAMVINTIGSGAVRIEGTGTYTGGTTLEQGTLQVRSGSALGTGGLTINGGTLASIISPRTLSNSVTVGGNFTLGGSGQAITLNGGLDLGGGTRVITTANSATLGGVISNGGITKQGAAALVLNANNTYTGATTVSAGSLIVNGNQSAASGILTVSSGATLGGSGTIGGATTISGILAPGNSIGTLTVANDVTWNSGNNWVFELGAAGPTIGSPGASDLLAITGGNDFFKGTGAAGSFTFDFAGTGDAGWYKLVDWAGGTTTFAANDFVGVNLGSVYSSEFTIQDNALYVNVVPEPSTYALLAVAAAGLGIHVVRRRRGSRH
jgi:autotransporter-associated beta strand protein